MQILNIESFLKESKSGYILDVRSPAEFEHGHIPGAISFPLFSNIERHNVGLCYKQNGPGKALLLGLEIVGPKLADFVRKAEIYRDKPLFVHCWRGGMRSNSMAMLLKTAGHEVHLLKKGYKAYRNSVLEQFEKPFKIVNLAGYTGTAKTEILSELAALGEQMVDLEGIAMHKGSAFGNLSDDKQPSSEQFENNLAARLLAMNVNKSIYVEDEGLCIGSVKLPLGFFKAMQHAPMLFIIRSKAHRIKNLLSTYSDYNDAESSKAAFIRIGKRLGGQNVKEAIEAIDNNDAQKAIEIALNYYDKYYYAKLNKRQFSRFIKVDGSDSNTVVAHKIIAKTEIIYG
jgi:tRNA 2-selenouridine synthase